jgi:HSP20 family molecular chaperone IbpA
LPLLPELSGFIAGLPPFTVLRSLLDRNPLRIEDETTEEGYELRAEIPGIDPADIDVTVEAGQLTIRAKRTSKTESTGRSEFSYGSFVRTVTLPGGANEDDITASYDRGILTVMVPLTQEVETKHIEVEATDSDEDHGTIHVDAVADEADVQDTAEDLSTEVAPADETPAEASPVEAQEQAATEEVASATVTHEEAIDWYDTHVDAPQVEAPQIETNHNEEPTDEGHAPVEPASEDHARGRHANEEPVHVEANHVAHTD